jgi:hypothetical protein
VAQYKVTKRTVEPAKKPRRTLGQVLAAQWLGIAGLGSIGLALGYIWYAKTYPPHIIYFAPVEVLIAAGIAMLGVWSFTT